MSLQIKIKKLYCGTLTLLKYLLSFNWEYDLFILVVPKRFFIFNWKYNSFCVVLCWESSPSVDMQLIVLSSLWNVIFEHLLVMYLLAIRI